MCSGNTSCTALVVIVDNTPPTFDGTLSAGVVDCYDNVQAEYDAFVQNRLTQLQLESMDECGGVNVSSSPANPNTVCEDGAALTPVTFTVEDECGNAISVVANFVITNTEGPTVADLPKSQRPINQKWSWDRILRSPYIKQADILQGFYLFEDQFSTEELEKHYDFYEPFTVHESSLSPCVHSIQAAKLDRMEQAYTFYLRTSRLDLDDYNKEVEEGLHITSMAGTWMSIVEGFGGMRIVDDKLSFTPKIPKQWDAFSFKINFRNRILKVSVSAKETSFELLGGQEDMSIRVKGERVVLKPNEAVFV